MYLISHNIGFNDNERRWTVSSFTEARLTVLCDAFLGPDDLLAHTIAFDARKRDLQAYSFILDSFEG